MPGSRCGCSHAVFSSGCKVNNEGAAVRAVFPRSFRFLKADIHVEDDKLTCLPRLQGQSVAWSRKGAGSACDPHMHPNEFRNVRRDSPEARSGTITENDITQGCAQAASRCQRLNKPSRAPCSLSYFANVMCHTLCSDLVTPSPPDNFMRHSHRPIRLCVIIDTNKRRELLKHYTIF
jgi:hypothetical protein